MKVKNKSVCQTCRTRKLGCDGLRPECSQCAFSGRACGGYQTSWTFVDSSSPVSTAKRKKRSQIKYDRDDDSGLEYICAQKNLQRDTLSRSNLVYAQTSLFTRPSQDESIALIVQSYVPRATAIVDSNNELSTTSYPRICGAWVEVLPNLSNEGAGAVVLDTAVQALATSIITQKLHPNRDDIRSFQRYELALRTLRRNVAVDQLFDSRILASIMCLSLVELMMPSTSVSLKTHLNGVSRLFQAYGPNAFKMGELHILFAGFRPLLLLEAFQSRQPTFLSSSSWIRVPFSVTTPSHMQSLLSQAAGIPSLLNQSDTLLKELPCQSSNDERVSELIRNFCDILNDLDRWEVENRRDSSDRWCYQPHDSAETNTTPAERACRYPNLQFTSVTAANIHTNLWAFRIICLTELQRLIDRVDYSDLSHTLPLLRPLSLTKITAHKVTLAQQICASMEYLLSDEMGLFGPASTYFPLQIAYEIFLGDQDRWHQDITFVECIVKRLVAKGLRSAPVLVTTRKTMRTAVSP